MAVHVRVVQVQAQPPDEENYYEGTIVHIHVEGGTLLYDVAYADCDEMDEKVWWYGCSHLRIPEVA